MKAEFTQVCIYEYVQFYILKWCTDKADWLIYAWIIGSML